MNQLPLLVHGALLWAWGAAVVDQEAPVAPWLVVGVACGLPLALTVRLPPPFGLGPYAWFGLATMAFWLAQGFAPVALVAGGALFGMADMALNSARGELPPPARRRF